MRFKVIGKAGSGTVFILRWLNTHRRLFVVVNQKFLVTIQTKILSRDQMTRNKMDYTVYMVFRRPTPEKNSSTFSVEQFWEFSCFFDLTSDMNMLDPHNKILSHLFFDEESIGSDRILIGPHFDPKKGHFTPKNDPKHSFDLTFAPIMLSFRNKIL